MRAVVSAGARNLGSGDREQGSLRVSCSDLWENGGTTKYDAILQNVKQTAGTGKAWGYMSSSQGSLGFVVVCIWHMRHSSWDS